MKVFYQCNSEGLPYSNEVHKAYLAFGEMGFETIPFQKTDDISGGDIEDVYVGGIGMVRKRLSHFGITVEEINYPEEIRKYLKRKIWTGHLNEINATPEMWPLFVKPVEGKRFTGLVIQSPKELVGIGSAYDDPEVLCSEVLNLKAEWRVFVRYGQILDVRQYKGDWRLHFNPQIIENCVSDYSSAPAGYGIDFGLTEEGDTVLIEVNDGYSLGSYGLFDNQYAKLLSARWAEMTGTEDACDFDRVFRL